MPSFKIKIKFFSPKLSSVTEVKNDCACARYGAQIVHETPSVYFDRLISSSACMCHFITLDGVNFGSEIVVISFKETHQICVIYLCGIFGP